MADLDERARLAHAREVTKSCCAPGAARGSQAVLAALLEKRGEFVAFAERQVRDAALAEELVQASFAKAAERIHQLESPEAARPWFYRMLRNAALDHRRQKSAEQRATTALAAEQADAVEAPERSPRVCQCVSRAMASSSLFSRVSRRTTRACGRFAPVRR